MAGLVDDDGDDDDVVGIQVVSVSGAMSVQRLQPDAPLPSPDSMEVHHGE